MTASNASARPAPAPSPGSSPARQSSPAREVCFVKYYQKGSTDIAADQMAVALRRRGLAARSIFAGELLGLHDAILVFVKRIDLLDLWRCKRAKNPIVVDVQDTVVFKRGIRYAAAWDGMIFRSRRALDDFGRGRAGAVLIPQHWDERYRPRTVPDDRLRLGFIGDPRSLPFTEPIPGLVAVFDDWFGRAPEFNAHLSVRGTRRELLYKPNNKVATAAACNAVLLTSRDEAAREHLGDARSLPFIEPIPGLVAVFDDWFGRAVEFNAHLSVRGTQRELLYKPNNKVATAAACNAVLLTSRDESARDHLGDDYPFYTDSDRESVLAAIAELERRVGGPQWRRALEKLAAVRVDTSLERTTDLYLDYLGRFGELETLAGSEGEATLARA